MHFRQKRRVGGNSGEGSSSSRSKPSSDPTSRSYQIMPARYLDQHFFSIYCHDVVDIIRHYQLEKLVYCKHDINIDLLSEFYNNLRKVGDGPIYRTRVARRELDFSPEILREFLECRPSTNTFVFYPSLELEEPFPSPFDHFNMNSMHNHFYHQPRDIRKNLFSANALSAPDNVLYKVIVGCILPIVTRGLALVRPPHLFMMYAFRHHLEINIALNVFHCIVHFITPIQGKVHMPLGNVITAWLASLGINVSRGALKPMTEAYDRITLRNFSLAGMKKGFCTMEWEDGHQQGEEAEEGQRPQAQEEEPLLLLDEPYESLSDHFARLESRFEEFYETVDTRLEELSIEHSAYGSQMTQMQSQFQIFEHMQSQFQIFEQRQLDIYEMLRTLTYGQQPAPGPPPPPPQAPTADDDIDVD